MNLKIAKMICKLQKIKMRVRVKVVCPDCGRRSLTLLIERDKAKCSHCHKTWTMMEILRICNEDYLDRHKMAYLQSKNNRGIKQ